MKPGRRLGMTAAIPRGLQLCAVLALACSSAWPDAGLHAQTSDERAAARLMDDLMWGRGTVGGPFELIDHTGHKRSDADFRGKLLMLYFGDTYCPDICPTDLQQIGLAIDRLGDAGAAVQPLFVSIDPERDTPEVLARYVPLFHPRLIGLTGTPEQIAAVAREYKVTFAKYQPPGGGPYLMDHTGFVYLVDATGKYRGFFPQGTSEERMREIILPILSERP
jgi:cytochrome oxidase Cu insertion factor (SCO1/SenC/PrrC family)